MVKYWSQHEKVLIGGDRTKNYAEAAHWALYSVLSASSIELYSIAKVN